MSAQIIDGKAIAAQTREKVAADVAALKEQGTDVGLAVILVGDDPASQVYVGNKVKACDGAGMISIEKRLPADTSFDVIAKTIQDLNADDSVHGVLLQLPLPDHLSDVQETLVQMIAPEKDVDGLTTVNAGKLFLGMDDGLVPCTPQGSMILIKSVCQDLSGKHAVVIGRSNLFGKPMVQLLLQENCTVTMTHSRTQGLASVCKQADILVAAVGRPRMVQADWIKDGAIVIDVGINRLPPNEEGKSKLCGDVDFDNAKEVAGAITPVPGGVGPMTITCLLANTVKAAKNTREKR